MASPDSHILSVNEHLYTSGDFSDLTIICQGEKFKVHKNYVCSQSKPLKAAVTGPFQEAITGDIDLDDNDPIVVRKFLEFLYMGDYANDTSIPFYDETIKKASAIEPEAEPEILPEASEVPGGLDEADDELGFNSKSMKKKSKSKSKAGKSKALVFWLEPFGSQGSSESRPSSFQLDPLLLNVKLYIMGDRYDVQPLKSMAKAKFEQVVVDNWNSSDFVESLELLYDETTESDRMLKDVAIKAAGENVKALTDRGEFATLCQRNGEIAFDVMKASLTVTPVKRVCPWGGVSHAAYVTASSQMYCAACRRSF